MQRCNAALPSEDIAYPSSVFECTVAGSILFLYWSPIISYMPVCTSKTAVVELIRALNLIPACTVTVGQSDTNPMV